MTAQKSPDDVLTGVVEVRPWEHSQGRDAVPWASQVDWVVPGNRTGGCQSTDWLEVVRYSRDGGHRRQRLVEMSAYTASGGNPGLAVIRAPVTSTLVVAFIKQVRGWEGTERVVGLQSILVSWRGGHVLPNR
jgi:hypothetical protein